MSTSKQQTQRPVALRRDELTMHERRVLDGATTRTDRAVSWLGWHVMELAGITVPVLMGAMVNGWVSLAALPTAAGWVAHKVSQTRNDRPRRTPKTTGEVSTNAGHEGDEQGEEVSA